MKIPTAKIPFDEISLSQKFRSAKIPSAKIPLAKIPSALGAVELSFEMLELEFFLMEKLQVAPRGPVAMGPRSFKCLYEMPPGSTAKVDNIFSIASLFMFGLKGGGGSFGVLLALDRLFSCRWGFNEVCRSRCNVC